MMARRIRLALMAGLWLGLAVSASAQDDAEPATNEPADAAAGDREVGVSEENYRRHMELGDVELQRNNFPVTDYAAQAELQKMVRLPEASQRHLRDQLRDQIMQLGAWSPSQTAQDHPFVPSPAARRDGELRGMESEAWDELVAEYQSREAELQAGAGRSGETGEAGAQGSSGPASGEAEKSLALDALAAAAAGVSKTTATPGSTASGQPPAGDPSARGASQSALDFLTGSGGASSPASPESTPAPADPGGSTSGQPAATPTTGAQASEPAAAGSQQNAAERLADMAQAAASANSEANPSSSPSDPSAAASDASAAPSNPSTTAAQAQAADAASDSAQNEDESDRDIEYQEQEGVLVIRELRNARGVVPVVAEPDDEEGEKQDADEQP